LLVKIGEGGMGTVYKGRHRSSGQIVAVKLVSSDVVRDTVLMKRFEKEFLTAKALDHPNIVRALDYQVMPDEALLVMEFVEGMSLGEKLEREGFLAEAEAILIIAQVAQALHYAHQRGLIHRDVKPDNILLTPQGQARLADLGLAKEMAASQSLTCTGRALGTPHFMAPEQFKSAKSADARSDVFSLAATLYAMLTGHLPFKAKGPLATFMKMVKNDLIPPRKLLPRLSKHLERVICKSLNADPQVRPATCAGFLQEILGQDPASVETGRGEKDLDLWYVDYEDAQDKPQVAVGTTESLRRSLRQGLLGNPKKIQVGRYRAGPAMTPLYRSELKHLLVGPGEGSDAAANLSAANTTRCASGSGAPWLASPGEARMVSCARDGGGQQSAGTLLDRLAWPLVIALALVGGVLLGWLVFPAK